MNIEKVTTSAAQTEELGEVLAKQLNGGEVGALSGDLGGGKTTFTKGLAKGLGIKSPITSPTFVLERKFDLQDGKKGVHTDPPLQLHHFDVYRLNNEQELLDLGFEEILSSSKNITIIEWAERVKKVLPSETIWVTFEWVDENERKIIIK